MGSMVNGADITAEIGRIIQEPKRLDENLALAKDYVDDVETLVDSMSNLYEEHAARLISVGVTVEVNVNVMHKQAFHSCLGLSLSLEGLVNANGEKAKAKKAENDN